MIWAGGDTRARRAAERYETDAPGKYRTEQHTTPFIGQLSQG